MIVLLGVIWSHQTDRHSTQDIHNMKEIAAFKSYLAQHVFIHVKSSLGSEDHKQWSIISS